MFPILSFLLFGFVVGQSFYINYPRLKPEITEFKFEAIINCEKQENWYYQIEYVERDDIKNEIINATDIFNKHGQNNETVFSEGIQKGDEIHSVEYELRARINHNCSSSHRDMSWFYKLENVHVKKDNATIHFEVTIDDKGHFVDSLISKIGAKYHEIIED